MNKTAVCIAGLAAAMSLAGAADQSRAQADIPAGHYVCFYFTRPLPLMNFTINGGGRYVDAGGKPGTYTFVQGRIVFHGGNFDGQRAVFRNQNPPKIAFMSDRNAETEVCQPGR